MLVPIRLAQGGDLAIFPKRRRKILNREGRFFQFRRLQPGRIGGRGTYVMSDSARVTYLDTDLEHMGVTHAYRKEDAATTDCGPNSGSELGGRAGGARTVRQRGGRSLADAERRTGRPKGG